MRVAIFTDNDFGKVNGVTTTLKAVLQHTADQASVRVYTASDLGVDTESYYAAPSVGIGLPFYPDMRIYWPRLARLAKAVHARGVDVVHLTTPGPVGLAGRRLAQRIGVPVVASYHTHLGDYARVLSGSTRAGNWLEAYVRWFYASSTAVLAPSRACVGLLAARGYPRAALRVWSRGVDAARFAPAHASAELRRRWKVDARRPAILYAGRLSREKDLELFPGIQRLLHRAAIAHQFVFAGDGPMRAELSRQMPDAVFLGSVPHRDVATAMASSDVFLFPSTTDTFGNVVLEAQASGLPTVVSDAGGPAEQIVDSETGYVCRAGDTRAFGEVLIGLLRNASLRQRMGLAAREWAEQSDWPRMLHPLIDAWRGALRAPAPASGALTFEPRRTLSH